MNIFIDLDGVVLDTVRLIADFKSLLVENGVSQTAVGNFYQNVSPPPGYMSRTFYLIRHPELHEALLGIGDGQKKQRLEFAIVDFFQDLQSYVFPDAKEFLEKLAKRKPVLVTYGGVDWQNFKVDRANLRLYFSQVIVTAGVRKAVVLAETQERGSTGYFIDDRGKEIAAVKAVFPGFTGIWVVRPGGRFNLESSDTHDYQVAGLQEAVSLVGMS